MIRKEITAEIVAEIEELLAVQFTPAEIAAYFGISPYVVEVIVHDDGKRNRPAPSPRTKSGFSEPKEQIDYATVRIIKRLIMVGVLSYPEIAREVGVSKNTVCALATGRRAVITFLRPRLRAGEKFLPQPIRCRKCGGRLVIVPCRACRTRLEKIAR
jgi:DNA-binding CsgD family transcriptional regulator